jgi:hypothetical protein
MFGDVDNPVSSYIKMNTESVTLVKGKTYTRTAIAASSAVIEYTVDDPEILEIDAEKGTITGLKDGKTMVWACATGYDGHGNKTYKTEKLGYEVIVQDPEGYIAYTEPEEKPEPLLLDIDDEDGITIEPIEPDDVWGADEFTYVLKKKIGEDTWSEGVAPNEDGVFVIKGADGVGTYKVVATVAKDGDNYITTEDYIEFDDETATAEYEIEVGEAVTYLAWDATEKALVEKIAAIPEGHKLSGEVAGGLYEAGIYYFDGNAHINATFKLGGDIDIIVKEGVMVNFDGGIDENDPTDPHTLNFFLKDLDGEAYTHVSIGGPSDAVKNVKEFNTHGVRISAYTEAAGCGGFSLVGAINIYDASVEARNYNWGTGESNGYGVKMKAGGIINLVKGSFFALGMNGEDAQPIAAGKLVYPEGYKFEESDNPYVEEPEWTDVEDDTPTKKAINCYEEPEAE